jgi:hypothetical protein
MVTIKKHDVPDGFIALRDVGRQHQIRIETLRCRAIARQVVRARRGVADRKNPTR